MTLEFWGLFIVAFIFFGDLSLFIGRRLDERQMKNHFNRTERYRRDFE